MSILRVANVQFNASGTRRIDYDATADDGIIKISADAIKLPVGDSASRPTLQAGMIRYNSDLGLFEGANSTAWGSIGGVVDFATANGWANTVGTAGNNYTNSVGLAGNNYTNYVGASANSYATTMDTAGNNYTNAVGLAGNNYTNAVGLAGNNYTNAAFTKANTALQNTSGTLAGSLTTTGTVTSNAYLYVTASDGINEGGEIQLSGAGNYAGWSLDAYQNNYRTFVRTGSTLANVTYFHATGGSVRMGVNTSTPAYTLDVNGTLSTSSRGITQASMPSGSILQVVSARNGDYFSTSSTTWTDITSLSLTITPTSSTSKIFLMLSFGRVTTNSGNLDFSASIRILGNGSDSLNINGNPSGSREKVAMVVNGWAFNGDHCPGGLGCSGLESPATTSAITYKAQVRVQSPAFIMNGTPNNADSGQTYHSRSQSSLTAWEIAQ